MDSNNYNQGNQNGNQYNNQGYQNNNQYNGQYNQNGNQYNGQYNQYNGQYNQFNGQYNQYNGQYNQNYQNNGQYNNQYNNQYSNQYNNQYSNQNYQYNNQNNMYYGGYNGPLNTNRSLFAYIALGIITCGIYDLYVLYDMVKSVNTACAGDGDDLMDFWLAFLLTLVTGGIFAYYYYYKIGQKLYNNAGRYGLYFQESGNTILLWMILGMVSCGICSLIGMYYLLRNTNQLCAAYNAYNMGQMQ